MTLIPACRIINAVHHQDRCVCPLISTSCWGWTLGRSPKWRRPCVQLECTGLPPHLLCLKWCSPTWKLIGEIWIIVIKCYSYKVVVLLTWMFVCFPGPMTSLVGQLSSFHNRCLSYMSRSVLTILLDGSCRIISWKSIHASTRSQSTQTVLHKNRGFWTRQVFEILYIFCG